MLNTVKELRQIEYNTPRVSKIILLCDHCGKIFRHTRNLRIHLRTHSTNRPRYPCQICQKTFLTRSLLNEHENVHLNTKPFECTICYKRFYGRANLRQHASVHNKSNFVCGHCGSTFSRKVNLSHHIKKIHLFSVVVQAEASPNYINDVKDKHIENIFQCNRCKKQFDTKPLLKEHRLTHFDITKCKLCGKIFSHHGSLTYHRRVVHNNERPYECISCCMKFAVKSFLDRHVQRVHMGETPFVCLWVDCKKSFHTLAALRSHKISHTPEPSFICHFCARKFRRQNALQVHLKIHSKERSFKCGVCGKMFSQKSNKLRHEKTHESKNNCFCKFCGKSFSRKSEYAQHALCKSKLITANQIHNLDEAEEMFDVVTQQIFS